MNDVAFDAALAQPARQPEPVATGLEGSTIRGIVRPALTPSSRQRSSSLRSVDGFGSNFFCG
jgi:hypothetical protein